MQERMREKWKLAMIVDKLNDKSLIISIRIYYFLPLKARIYFKENLVDIIEKKF